ncbi:CpsD/CapB family tyrosine-protein kinase [Butyrivibrio sp. JL13D10]|uniref:CpsD/CapB family tyrosine-protein kinase n=1 Tax=Butyrivibrio sp. JL13D10 TaxID=3236815 RepID=UPI0038B68DAE
MSEKLELYTLNSNVLNNSIDKIVVKLHGLYKKDHSKMFLCTGAGANGGTTTVAINIAISLAEAGWKTVFVDCDLRKDQRFKRIGGEVKLSLTDYITGGTTAYRRIIYGTNVNNLDYVVAGDKNDNPVRLLCNAKLESFLEDIKKDYDFIIIDTPPVGITNDAEILIPYVDKYMLIVSMNETTKRQLVEARVQLENYEDKYIGVIVNRMEMGQYSNTVKDFDYYTSNKQLQKQKRGMSKRKDK